MERIFKYTIQPGDEKQTIEQYLRNRGYSHHILTHLKRTVNGICLNHTWAYTNQKPEPGDLLTILLTEEGSDAIPAAPVPFRIVYEDEDLLVADKPADTPVHPSQGNYENTLANGVVWYFQQKNQPFTFRCINRLDRDTTGLLIIAKHALSGAILSAQMSRREISRTYEALVFGTTALSGTIDIPIGRKEGSTIERVPDPIHGDPAVTHFETPHAGKSFSHVRLKLETGRTHQIRAHMKHIGHPLFNDERYGGNEILRGTQFSKYKQFIQNCFAVCPRQALHARTLGFIHPRSGQEMYFTSELPADMTALLERWRSYTAHRDME